MTTTTTTTITAADAQLYLRAGVDVVNKFCHGLLSLHWAYSCVCCNVLQNNKHIIVITLLQCQKYFCNFLSQRHPTGMCSENYLGLSAMTGLQTFMTLKSCLTESVSPVMWHSSGIRQTNPGFLP